MKINKFFIKILIVYFFIFNLTHCLISAQEFNDVILSKQGKTYICKMVKKDSANIYFDFKPRDTVIYTFISSNDVYSYLWNKNSENANHDSLYKFSPYKKHILSLTISDIILNRCLVTYALAEDRYHYIEFTFGYRYVGPISYTDNGGGINLNDFMNLDYNMFTARLGLRKYLESDEHIFIGYDLNFNYAYNNQVSITEETNENTINNYSEYKYQFGGLVKFGLSVFPSSHFLMEPYMGIGGLISNAISIDKDNSNNSSNNTKFIPTIYLGLSIGGKW